MISQRQVDLKAETQRHSSCMLTERHSGAGSAYPTDIDSWAAQLLTCLQNSSLGCKPLCKTSIMLWPVTAQKATALAEISCLKAACACCQHLC